MASARLAALGADHRDVKSVRVLKVGGEFPRVAASDETWWHGWGNLALAQRLWPNAAYGGYDVGVGGGAGAPPDVDVVVNVSRASCDHGALNRMFLKHLREFDAHKWADALRLEEKAAEGEKLGEEGAAEDEAPGGAKLRVTYIDRQNTLRSLPPEEHEWIMATLPTVPVVAFRRVRMEDHSFEEQLAIARGTDVLLGVHGKGMTHQLFMRPGRFVIEYFPSSQSYLFDVVRKGVAWNRDAH